jgi:hypothetical protein
MNRIWTCRRTFIALVTIGLLAALGFYLEDTSVAMSMAGVAVGLAGANAYEKTKNGGEE